MSNHSPHRPHRSYGSKMLRLRNVGFILAITTFSIVFAARLLAFSDTESATATTAIAVSTDQLKISSSYQRSRTFTGRASAKQHSKLGFEISGTLIEINADDGDTFAKGDILGRLDTRRLEAKLEQLMAQNAEHEANQQLAKNTYARIKKTNKQGHASQQLLDESYSKLMAANARKAANDAAIKSLKIDLEKSVITAPFEVLVISRMVDIGSVLPAGSAVFDVIDSSNIEAKIGVTPSLAKRLSEGAAFQLRNDLREPIAGEFVNTISAIRGQTRTMLATFKLTSQVADGEIITLAIDDPIEARGAWVPIRALSADVRGLWRVYKVAQGSKGAEIRFENVQLLHTSGEMAYVSGSFSDGDIIVTEGVGKLSKGQRVNPMPAKISE